MSPTLQIVIAGVGTYLIRVSSIALLGSGRSLPPQVERTLRFVAPAALASLVANSLLVRDGDWRPLGNWHVAIVVAGVMAVWKKSPAWTLVAGMTSVWILNAWF